MTQRLVMIIALMLLTAPPAFATHDEDRWGECQTGDGIGDECAVIMGGCDYLAVNRDFLSPAEDYFTELRTRIRCFAPPGPKPDSAACVKQKCVTVKKFTFDATTMTTWTIEDHGLTIRLTPAGEKALNVLTASHVGAPVEFWLNGTRVTAAVVNEPLQHSQVLLFLKEEEKPRLYKLLQDHTICAADEETCFIPEGSLRPAADP